MSDIDYGPLAGLIGTWRGDTGEDTSPEPDGTEHNQYTETIRFAAAGDTDNAETQELVAMHYWLDVHRIRDGKHIHHQTGYWIWDAEGATVMHAFSIPRGLALVAGGSWRGETDADGNIVLDVEAAADHPQWPIAQSPFLAQRARTTSFRQRLTIGADAISYAQTTLVDIYAYSGFEHTDRNRLLRV